MAAGDIALRAVLSAVDAMSPVVVKMASTFDSSIASMSDSALALDSSLSTVDASLSSLVPALVDADGNIVALNVSMTDSASVAAKYGLAVDSASASMGTLDASAAATDASLAAVDASAAGASTAVASTAVAADASAASLGMMTAAAEAGATAMEGLKAAAGFLTILAAAVGVTDIVSVKMAADFQQAMLSNVAHAGLAKSEFDRVSQSVLAMSSAVGRSPTQLAEALYPILSAFSGIQNQAAKSAIALDTLKMSFQAVAGTTVDGTAVANAAVGTFNALGLATNNVSTNTARMTGLFDVMDKTVMLGNMQWDAYKNVVSKLAVAIQGTGISFNESQAALATMTNEGFTAQKASTYLTNTFTTLAIKTDSLAKHAKSLGISFDAAKYGPMSLADKIQYLNQITDGNKQKLLALMGNNSTALKTFNALSIGINSYKDNLNSLNHAQGALKSSFDTASQGFNFQMQQVKAAGQAFMVTLGTDLLPIFSKLVSNITPIITGLMKWENQTHGIENAMNALVGVISKVVSVGAGIISFFAHNQVALAALGIVLVAAAGAIGGLLVAAFIAWAVAAWSAAIATIAATWPILAIGAAIALLVVGIILAIQHWGQIVAWLKGVWGGISSWFGGIFSQIGTFAHGVVTNIGAWFSGLGTKVRGILTGIKNFFGNIFSGLGTAAHNAVTSIGQKFSELGTHVHNAMNGAKNAFQTGMTNIKNFAQTGVNGVVNSFKWLYDHNYYFKNLVDNIKTTFTNGIKFWQSVWTNFTGWLVAHWNGLKASASAVWNLITSTITNFVQMELTGIQIIWNKITSWLASVWNTIKSTASTVWNDITTTISNFLQMEWTGIQIIWNKIVSFLQSTWNTITTAVGTAWGKISAIFSSAWSTYIAAPLTAIGTNIKNFFAGLATLAVTWGKNLIQGLINGIGSMLGAVGNAASNVASTIAKFLGFHSPAAEGEGRHIIEWGQNAVKSFAQGMQMAQPLLNAQVSHLFVAPSGATGSVAPISNNNNSRGPVTFHNEIHIHTQQLANADINRVTTMIGDKLRAQANI